MSSPSTAAYLRSGELTRSLPATMQVLGQFRFISKASGGAATTAEQTVSPRVPLACPLPTIRPSTSGSSSRSGRSGSSSRSGLSRAAHTPSAAACASCTARAASVNEAPVVIRSSTSTTGPPPASSRAPPPTTSSAPARLSDRCREFSPDWSATARRCRRTPSTRAGVPVRRSSPAAASAIRRAGSCPRARTALRAEGTGTSRTALSPGLAPRTPSPSCSGHSPSHPASPLPRLSRPCEATGRPAGPGRRAVSRAARTAPARAAPSGAAKASAPRSL